MKKETAEMMENENAAKVAVNDEALEQVSGGTGSDELAKYERFADGSVVDVEEMVCPECGGHKAVISTSKQDNTVFLTYGSTVAYGNTYNSGYVSSSKRCFHCAACGKEMKKI